MKFSVLMGDLTWTVIDWWMLHETGLTCSNLTNNIFVVDLCKLSSFI